MYQKQIQALHTTWQGLSGNARGSVWLLIGGLCATIMITGIKFVGQRLPVIEILFFRQMFVFLFLAPVIAGDFPAAFRTKRVKMHVARCAVSIVAMTTGFTAIVHLPLAEATSISISRAVFATLLAVLR